MYHVCSSATCAVAVPWPAVRAGRHINITAPPQHWEGKQLRSSLHYQSQLPSVNHCDVGERPSLALRGGILPLHDSVFVTVCHCLSHRIIETQNSKDTSNYLAMRKYIIKFLTESTHIGSNLDGILGYGICVSAQQALLDENSHNHGTSIVSYLNEVAFCLWRLQIKFCNEISSCEDIRNNLVRGAHRLNSVIFCEMYFTTQTINTSC